MTLFIDKPENNVVITKQINWNASWEPVMKIKNNFSSASSATGTFSHITASRCYVFVLLPCGLPFRHVCFSCWTITTFQIVMTIASGSIQQKVPEVRRQWAGEGETTPATAWVPFHTIARQYWVCIVELLCMWLHGRCKIDLSVGRLRCQLQSAWLRVFLLDGEFAPTLYFPEV